MSTIQFLELELRRVGGVCLVNSDVLAAQIKLYSL